MVNSSRTHIIFSLLGLSIALYFACFHHIQRLPINLWDESLFFMRAFHFYEHGSYMPNFNLYDYTIDHRNTKLPFTTFSQVLGLKIFGISTLALRVPILVIFITTVFYIVKFVQNEFGRYGVGIIAGLIMISSTGFLRDHMLRTGDQDVPFSCYILLATFFFYRFELYRRAKDLWIFGFWVLAALLTKNLLIGLLLPGLVMYCLIRGSLWQLIKDKRIYILLAGLVGIYVALISYYDYRFPGFFERMWNYELFGRYTNTIDGHKNGFFYFVKTMSTKDFYPFAFFIPVAIVFISRLSAYARYRNFVYLLGSVFILYLLGISISSTKVFWYSAPLYPLGAMIIAFLFCPKTKENDSRLLKKSPLIASLFLMLPYSLAIKSINNPQTIYQSSKLGSFLINLSKVKPDLKDFTFFDSSFGTGAGFYIEQAKNRGMNIQYKRKVEFELGERVALCRHTLTPLIQKEYSLNKLFNDKDCVIYQLSVKE